MGFGRINRLGIYFFYDVQGIADEYVFCFLDGIREFFNELYIVCNEPLLDRFRNRFLTYTSHLLVRRNQGMDVGAYRETMEHIGYEQLGKYDELVMMNATIFGPLYPFSELFEEMDRRALDFWGITSHAALKWNPFPKNGLSELPAHIQSHFLAVRRRMLCSPAFAEYWRALPDIQNYEDSVGLHEVRFTRHFERLGFLWGTYTGTEKMEKLCPNPIITAPLTLIKERRCPILKRRSFFQDYRNLLHDTNGGQGAQLIMALEEYKLYDTGLIWDNLLRTCNHADLRRCLHLNYILPNHMIRQVSGKRPRTALWMHIYYPDLIAECFHYASFMPADADVLVTTDTAEKQEKIRQTFSGLSVRRVEVLLVENRGRDNSALLVGCAPYLSKYDLVCFAHDKKVGQLPYQVQGQSFMEHCYENVLKSREFVQNVITLFADHSRLGILCPPPPYASVYYNTIGWAEWGPNYENTKALYDRLGLTVPIDPQTEPIAPFGSVFWFRTAALERLFRQGWKYSDFPQEPVDFDGTMLHALERIYPFAAQQSGYYSGWLLSESFAAVEFTNYHYMLRELNIRLLPKCGSEDFHSLCTRVEKLVYPSWRMLYQPLKRWMKRHLSERSFYRLQKLKKRIFREP